ncbi:MAG: cell division protein FtsA, partial [Tannerella sp.]|nr:cell division protein FtsA [Tannerella sp.]
MRNYIVAIDLGTSHFTGIVGERKPDGKFFVKAHDTVLPTMAIQRGNVHNLEKTATHVNELVAKLERRLNGGYIRKIYVSAGGQSIRTVDHKETKEIEDGVAVTNDDINSLKEQCRKFNIDMLDVLDIAPAVYYVDGHKETNPVGVPGKQFDAHYKLVVGSTSIRRTIKSSIEDRAKRPIAGIVIAPLALADAMLGKEDRELGCALVDFGAGVTSVSIYKNGDLRHLSVIPLGSNLINKDIKTSLQLPDAEAEKLKKERGSATYQKEDENKSVNIEMEASSREIVLNDLSAIVEGRVKEIVENVNARISEAIDIKSLGSGIILAGGGAELRNLPELVKEICKVKVRQSAIHDGLVTDAGDLLGDPLYMTAIGIMLKGTENCVEEAFV